MFETGDLKMSHKAAETGWLLCDGATYNEADHPALAVLLGANNGQFSVPDYRGRTLVGSGAGGGLTARALGDNGGAESVQLFVGHMPSHSHSVVVANQQGAETQGPANARMGRGTFDRSLGAYRTYLFVDENAVTNTATLHPNTVSAAGGNIAHENMPPFSVAHIYIKT